VQGQRAQPHMRGTVARIARGDILLCYLTGVMRWVGALEVIGRRVTSPRFGPGRVSRPSRSETPHPPRPGHRRPMEALRGKVHFYQTTPTREVQGLPARSPHQFKRTEDGQLVLELLRQAEASPVSRPVDPGSWRRFRSTGCSVGVGRKWSRRPSPSPKSSLSATWSGPTRPRGDAYRNRVAAPYPGLGNGPGTLGRPQ